MLTNNMELELYSNIKYNDCYEILVDYSQNPNKYALDGGFEESKVQVQEQEQVHEYEEHRKNKI